MKNPWHCLAFLTALLPATALAADPDPALIKQAAATAGGQIVFYSALNEESSNHFVNGFNAAYGKSGLHVKLARYQSGALFQLYEQEVRANKVSSDAILLVDPSLFLELQAEKHLTPYCSANFKDYRPFALSRDCTYFTATTYYEYMVYNTDLMKTAPTSWNDLVDPQWKGKTSIPDPKIGGGLYYFTYTIDKLFGPAWFDKAHANQVQTAQGLAIAENQVMSGERWFSVTSSEIARRDGPYPKGKGAPIREVFPKEGSPLLAAGVGISVNGPNPAGAKVFVDWLASREGQQAVNYSGFYSLRKDFTDQEGDNLDQMKYLWWDPVDMEKNRKTYTDDAIRRLNGVSAQ